MPWVAPKRGWYLFDDEPHDPEFVRVVFCSGERKGNFWLDADWVEDGWAKLQWNCLPKSNEDFQFFPTQEGLLKALKEETFRKAVQEPFPK